MLCYINVGISRKQVQLKRWYVILQVQNIFGWRFSNVNRQFRNGEVEPYI